MAKASDKERRRFLRDLGRLADDVTPPLGATEQSAPRTRDTVRGELTWRLRVEPEEPMFPAMFRLTWGVHVPGVTERKFPPSSKHAKYGWVDYESALWAEDVEQLRTGKGRIYKYRLGPPVGRLSRLNPFTPDQTLPLTEMTDYLTTLVGATLPPLMRMLSTRNDLADWMQANPSLCGRAGLTDLLAQEVAILRST